MRSDTLIRKVRADSLDHATVFAVAGELDSLGARPLQRAVLDALRRDRPAHITIDLRAVTFLDTAGVSMLITIQADAEQLGCRLHLANARPLVRRILRTVGLLELFRLETSEPSTPGRPPTPPGLPQPGSSPITD
jgi:anti-sigma B factor antagonist